MPNYCKLQLFMQSELYINKIKMRIKAEQKQNDHLSKTPKTTHLSPPSPTTISRNFGQGNTQKINYPMSIKRTANLSPPQQAGSNSKKVATGNTSSSCQTFNVIDTHSPTQQIGECVSQSSLIPPSNSTMIFGGGSIGRMATSQQSNLFGQKNNSVSKQQNQAALHTNSALASKQMQNNGQLIANKFIKQKMAGASGLRNGISQQQSQPQFQQRSQTQMMLARDVDLQNDMTSTIDPIMPSSSQPVSKKMSSSNLALVEASRIKRDHEQLVMELARLSPLKNQKQSQRKQAIGGPQNVNYFNVQVTEPQSSQNQLNLKQTTKQTQKIKQSGVGQKLDFGYEAIKSEKIQQTESSKRGKTGQQSSDQKISFTKGLSSSSKRQLTKLNLEDIDGPLEAMKPFQGHQSSQKYITDAQKITQDTFKAQQMPRTNFGSYMSNNPTTSTNMGSHNQIQMGQIRERTSMAQSSFLQYSAQNNNRSAQVSALGGGAGQQQVGSNGQSMSINNQISLINATNSNQSSFLRHSRNNSQSTSQIKPQQMSTNLVTKNPTITQNGYQVPAQSSYGTGGSTTKQQQISYRKGQVQKSSHLNGIGSNSHPQQPIKSSSTHAQLATQMSLGSFPQTSNLLAPSNLITSSTKRPRHRHTGSALLVMPPHSNQRVVSSLLGEPQIVAEKNVVKKNQSGNHNPKKASSALGTYTQLPSQPALTSQNTHLISMQRLGGAGGEGDFVSDLPQKHLNSQIVQLEEQKRALKNSISTFKSKQGHPHNYLPTSSGQGSQNKAQLKSSRKANVVNNFAPNTTSKMGVKSGQTSSKTALRLPQTHTLANNDKMTRSSSRKRIDKNQIKKVQKTRQKAIPAGHQKDVSSKVAIKPKQTLNQNFQKQVPQSTKNALSKQKQLQKELLSSFYNPKKGSNLKQISSLSAVQSLKQILSPKVSSNQATMVSKPQHSVNIDGSATKQSSNKTAFQQQTIVHHRKTKSKQIVSSLCDSEVPTQAMNQKKKTAQNQSEQASFTTKQGSETLLQAQTALTSNRSSLQSSFIKVGFNCNTNGQGGQQNTMDNSNISINQYGLKPDKQHLQNRQQSSSQINLIAPNNEPNTQVALKDSAKSRHSSVKKRQIIVSQLKAHQKLQSAKGTTLKHSPKRIGIISPLQRTNLTGSMHSATQSIVSGSARKTVKNVDKKDNKEAKMISTGLSSSKTQAILPQSSSNNRDATLSAKNDLQQPPRNLQTALGLTQNFTGQLSAKGMQILQQITNSSARKNDQAISLNLKSAELKTVKSSKQIQNSIEVNQKLSAIIKDQVARKNRVQVKSSLAVLESHQNFTASKQALQKKILTNKQNVTIPRSQQNFYHLNNQTSQKQLIINNNDQQNLKSSIPNTQMKTHSTISLVQDSDHPASQILKQFNSQNEIQIKKAQDKLGGKSLASNLHHQYSSQKSKKMNSSLYSPKQRLSGAHKVSQPNPSGAFSSQISAANNQKKQMRKQQTSSTQKASTILISDFSAAQVSEKSDKNAASSSQNQQSGISESQKKQNQKLEILGIYKYARQQVRARGRRGDQVQHPNQLQARQKPLAAAQSQAILTQLSPNVTSGVGVGFSHQSPQISQNRPISHHSRQKSLQDAIQASQSQNTKKSHQQSNFLPQAQATVSAIERDYKDFIDGENLIDGNELDHEQQQMFQSMQAAQSQLEQHHASSSKNLKRQADQQSDLLNSEQIQRRQLATTLQLSRQKAMQSQLSAEVTGISTSTNNQNVHGLSQQQLQVLRQYEKAQVMRQQRSECQLRQQDKNLNDSFAGNSRKLKVYQDDLQNHQQLQIASSQIFDQQNSYNVARNPTNQQSVEFSKPNLDKNAQNTNDLARGRARLTRKEYLQNQEINSQQINKAQKRKGDGNQFGNISSDKNHQVSNQCYQEDRPKQKGQSLSAISRVQDQMGQNQQATEALQLYAKSKQVKRREFSEPNRMTALQTHKMYVEADLLVLEDRSNSRQRSFKIFEDKRVFSQTRVKRSKEQSLQDNEEKHDECDYDTEPEHVYKARELMLEDLHESIKFFVTEKPTDLVYNLQLRRSRR